MQSPASTRSSWSSILKGLWLTLRHVGGAFRQKSTNDVRTPGYFLGQNGIATISWPHEQIPIPDTGRYRLHNETDDCIVCDKCAKICPVDCITIEAVRAPDEFGKTSDGTPKRIHAAKFDIDMAKCCFCGLCTTVCPTECLTMTPDFDYSTFNIADHYVAFGTMKPEEVELRKKEWDAYAAQKIAAPTPAPSAAPKPAFKPRIQPPPQS